MMIAKVKQKIGLQWLKVIPAVMEGIKKLTAGYWWKCSEAFDSGWILAWVFVNPQFHIRETWHIYLFLVIQYTTDQTTLNADENH